MTTTSTAAFVPYRDLLVELDGHVGIIRLNRPPHNFFDNDLIHGLVEAFDYLDGIEQCRVVLLTSEGKAFCAGANFNSASPVTPRQLYKHAVRLFRTKKPIVAAVNGPAIGGGLGLALIADFRVVDADTRFSANFNRLGFHQGFGMSVTFPRIVGVQQAALLLHTGRRIDGKEAVRIGLGDVLAETGTLLATARALCDEIAMSAPLAVMATRATLRAGLADQIDAMIDHEATEQEGHFETADFKEGVAAMTERRTPNFIGA